MDYIFLNVLQGVINYFWSKLIQVTFLKWLITFLITFELNFYLKPIYLVKNYELISQYSCKSFIFIYNVFLNDVCVISDNFFYFSWNIILKLGF